MIEWLIYDELAAQRRRHQPGCLHRIIWGFFAAVIFVLVAMMILAGVA